MQPIVQPLLDRNHGCFNPHPARRPDATLRRRSCHKEWSGFNPHPARRPDATRYTGDMLRVILEFQSSPGQKAGCNGVLALFVMLTSSFQSSPGQKAGCNKVRIRSLSPSEQVSILTRPEGRMQRLYLNFLSVLREPPDTGLPICFHCPDHFFPPATIQL